MAEEEELNEESPEKPKKKVNMLAILGIGQVVLTGGLGAALIFSLQGLNDTRTNTDQMKERAIASVKDEVAEIQFVDMDPFITNTTSKSTVKATFNVEVSDAKTAAVFAQRMPAIRARILALLSQQHGKALRKMQDKLLLKDSLREVMNYELEKAGVSEGVVRDVYFLDFLVI